MRIVILTSILLTFAILGFALDIKDPPQINPIPRVVTTETIIVSGKTCPYCTVYIEVNEEKFSTISNEKGEFSYEIFLKLMSENKIKIYSMLGGEKSPEVKITVIHSTAALSFDQPPIINYEKVPRFTREPGIEIEGMAPPKTLIVAKGGSAEATSFSGIDGRFKVFVPLKFDTMNELKITAETEEGYITPPAFVRIYQITKAPPAPQIEEYPKITKEDTLKLYGKTVPGTIVFASGGGKVISAEPDGEGNFSLEIQLMKDTVNEIEVFSRDPAGNLSPQTKLTIKQDSTPPPPPEIEKYDPETIGDVEVVGSSEPWAEIFVKIYEKEINLGKVGDDGKFSFKFTPLEYTRQKRLNTVEIVAVDEALNKSDPKIINIIKIPNLKKGGTEISIGPHFFNLLGLVNIQKNEFFEKAEGAGRFSIGDFWGLNIDVSTDYLLQRGSGLAVGTNIGGNTSFIRKINFPSCKSGELKVIDPEECLKMEITTVYATPEAKVAVLIENMDFLIGLGAGPVFIRIRAPQQEMSNGTTSIVNIPRSYFTFGIRGSLKWRYFLRKNISFHTLFWYMSAVKDKVNPDGDSINAGGSAISFGIGFHF